MNEWTIQRSRPAAAAAGIKQFAPDYHRFSGEKAVLLTGDERTLATQNGRNCFLSCIRLLPRICRNVVVWPQANPQGLRDAASEIARSIQFDVPVQFVDAKPQMGTFDAILNVGVDAAESLPWTSVNADGWIARVSSKGGQLPPSSGQENAISSLAAACLGVAEVFKRLICLQPRRGGLLSNLSFSLFDYTTDGQSLGPALPMEIPLDVTMVGAGAIGNGIAYLLTELPVVGTARVVDRQCFGEENLGTCLLIGPKHVTFSKAEILAGFLKKRLHSLGYHEDVETFSRRLRSDFPIPSVVINGLDDVDARHQVQSLLWPELIIDGAIGDFACQVSRHAWNGDEACLMCAYPKQAGESAIKIERRATGLSELRLLDPDSLVTIADVNAAPEDRRDFLAANLGRTVCSVTREGVAQLISLEKQDQKFQPSVPFVACLSACMVIAELVKHATKVLSPLDGRFQFDSLVGPMAGQMFPERRHSTCSCVTRRSIIGSWRQKYLRSN